MATCNKPQGGGVLSFLCELEAGHDGPCMAQGNDRSIRARRAWEAEQRHQASGLGEFQGRPQTTAERYTENPTPVPGGEAEPPFRVNDRRVAFTDRERDGQRIRAETEPTKQRPGDQPLPTESEWRDIQPLVVTDIESRMKVGIERYGRLLQPANGRDMVQDAYEEALDLTVYLRGVIEERLLARVALAQLLELLGEDGRFAVLHRRDGQVVAEPVHARVMEAIDLLRQVIE